VTDKSRPRTQVAEAKASIANQGPMVVSAVPNSKAYLHCVFRVSKDGKVNLLHATEVAGDPLMPEATGGGFLYEIARGTEVIATQGMADPFEIRAFPAPKESKLQGHHFESAEEAEIVVKIPNTRISDTALNEISLSFYEYQGPSHLNKLDKDVLFDLNAKHQLKHISEIPVRALGQTIHERFVPAAK
jgi:hypothetical protein